ncbi:MAG TPA: DUF1614 domain-containing protein [Ktedonobacterales bacterium]
MVLFTALVAAALLLTLLYLNAATRVFQLLGLSPLGAAIVIIASLLGGMVNIPLTRRRLAVENPLLANLPAWLRQIMPLFYYFPPAVVEQVVAVNVGGALIPITFSIYLFMLPTTPFVAAISATILVAAIAKLFARPLPGQGITLPAFIPPLVAAITAHIFVVWLGGPAASAAPVAYISGTLGTLIGADLLSLPRVLRGSLLGTSARPIRQRMASAQADDVVDDMNEASMLPESARTVVSIGGAGVFDGIFVTSVLAPLLAALL